MRSVEELAGMNGSDVCAAAPVVEAVEPRDGWRIWVRFADGVEGEIDVSSLREGTVFSYLEDRREFEKVYVDPDLQMVCWGKDLEISLAWDWAQLQTAAAAA